MSKRRKKQNVKRDASVGFLLSGDAYTTLCGDGYTPLNKNPEVVTACGVIAELIISFISIISPGSIQGLPCSTPAV